MSEVVTTERPAERGLVERLGFVPGLVLLFPLGFFLAALPSLVLPASLRLLSNVTQVVEAAIGALALALLVYLARLAGSGDVRERALRYVAWGVSYWSGIALGSLAL